MAVPYINLKLNQKILLLAIVLVMLLTTPTSTSPTQPTTVVLVSHTIFLPSRSWAEWHSWCGRQSLVKRNPEKLNLEVITDLKADLRWVAKQIEANPHLKGNGSMSYESHRLTPAKTGRVRVTHQAQPQYNVLLDEETEVLVEEQHGRADKNCIQVLQLILCHMCYLQEDKMRCSMNHWICTRNQSNSLV